MAADPIPDINAVIAGAVNARIEAEVVAALAGDAVIGQFVAAALNQQIELEDRSRSYQKIKTTFIANVLRKAIQEATQAAVANVILEELPTIEAEVRKALKRDIAGIAAGLAKTLEDVAKKAYGINVAMTLRMPNDY